MMMGRKPPWPSGRRCWSAWLGRLAQRLSSTTLLFSSTQRCISGFWQPVSMEKAAAARRGAATWAEHFMLDWLSMKRVSGRYFGFGRSFSSLREPKHLQEVVYLLAPWWIGQILQGSCGPRWTPPRVQFFVASVITEERRGHLLRYIEE